MFLVADSGSTKTEWRFFDGVKSLRFHTAGINPLFLDEAAIAGLLKAELWPSIKEVIRPSDKFPVYFYGAACSSAERCAIVRKGIAALFKQADIEVDHDLLAAARATCGDRPGIACIIGTGSNSCYYDGKNIAENIPALGYILGDEGSGAYLGKKLIAAFLYGELPEELSAALEKAHQMDKEIVIESVYKKPLANRYLASFGPFLHRYKEHSWVKSMVRRSFDDFLHHHVCKYEASARHEVHFVGSIAFHFSNILEEALKAEKLKSGKFHMNCADGLVLYHSRTPS